MNSVEILQDLNKKLVELERDHRKTVEQAYARGMAVACKLTIHMMLPDEFRYIKDEGTQQIPQSQVEVLTDEQAKVIVKIIKQQLQPDFEALSSQLVEAEQQLIHKRNQLRGDMNTMNMKVQHSIE